MRCIFFFATRDDLLPVFEAVEGEAPLQYVRTGNELSPDFETFHRGADITNLGKADHDSASSCEQFLVTLTDVSIRIRQITGIGGIPRYCMDQEINPDTVRLIPAGIWGGDFLFRGGVDTISKSAIAQGLMKRFYAAIRKRFTKVSAFWVGPEALALLRAGKRLTDAAQCPREFDLALGPPDPATDDIA